MVISAAAKGNQDQLFGDRVSALAQSDPELIEYFGNFAFGEVHADAARPDETLGLHTGLMVQLAAILAAGGLAEFRVVAAAAVANGGVSPVELKEIVYQSVAYAGMARASGCLHAVNDLLTEAGAGLPLPGQSASTPQTRLEHGKAVQGRRRRGLSTFRAGFVIGMGCQSQKPSSADERKVCVRISVRLPAFLSI